MYFRGMKLLKAGSFANQKGERIMGSSANTVISCVPETDVQLCFFEREVDYSQCPCKILETPLAEEDLRLGGNMSLYDISFERVRRFLGGLVGKHIVSMTLVSYRTDFFSAHRVAKEHFVRTGEFEFSNPWDLFALARHYPRLYEDLGLDGDVFAGNTVSRHFGIARALSLSQKDRCTIETRRISWTMPGLCPSLSSPKKQKNFLLVQRTPCPA